MAKVTIKVKDPSDKETSFGSKTLTKLFNDENNFNQKYEVSIQEPSKSDIFTIIGNYTVRTKGATDPNKPPVVDAGEAISVKENVLVTLNGSAKDEDGRIVRVKWTAPDGISLSSTTELNPTFTTPTLLPTEDIRGLVFLFEAEDDKAEIVKDSVIVTVTKSGELPPPPPVPTGNFPVAAKMYYSSDMVLSHDGTFPSKQRSPFDPILLFSNASGVQSHTVKDGWLIINTGDEFGRCYWEMYDLPDFKTTQMGLVTVFAGVFKMTTLANDSDFSIKLGDHGTTGYTFDGKKFFGGFGLSFHAKEIQSKCEWKHGTPEGTEKIVPYKNGQSLQVGKEYPFFVTWVADQSKNTCTLNVWIDFGNGWELTMKDRVWEKDSEWTTKAKSLPTDALDYEDTQKGPAFIKCDHIWTRANQGDVDVQKIQIGTLQS